MHRNARFFDAGRPACVAAEQQGAAAIDRQRFQVVHLGEPSARIAEARAAGAIAVPALVLQGRAFHIGFGAARSGPG